ncbi:MAG: hypothetical protein JWO38_2673 [Gemmataceae bacterium]|nr:hypothetical protein [Gemmataceae bacterium]
MRTIGMWLTGLVAAIAWAVAAPAADKAAERKQGHVPEEGAVQVMLLRQKSVQDDLKLANADTTKIHDFATRQWKKAQEFDKLSPKEQDEKYRELTRENEKFLAEVLKPEQKKRLDQITMQVAGLMWVTRPELAAAIGLTAEQKKKAKELQKEAHDEAHKILSENVGRELKAEELKQLREKNRKRLMDLLTDDQEKKWKELAGTPFTGELYFGPPKKPE